MDQLASHHSLASTDRWEQLKPIIKQLYLKDKKKLAEIVPILKRDHGFDAVEHQYKHHFKKWQWKKNIPKSKKDLIAEQLQSRAQAGKPSPSITLQGRPVELDKIRRHMKMKARADSKAIALKTSSDIRSATGPVLPFANRIFLKWNIPYAALRQTHAQAFNYTSPLGFSAPTPGSDISMHTPSSAASPPNAPSPGTVFLKRKMAIDRAHLFAQGQFDKLYRSMDGEERRIMSEWLYQYWFFCFTTAKNWGRGPRAWTAELLDFARFHPQSHRSLPGTPRDSMSHSEEQPGDYPVPTDLCRWFIHVEGAAYEEIPEEEVPQDLADHDPNDESTWALWPQDWQEPPLPTRLRDGLEHNDFSSISSAALPVAIPEVAKAAQRSPDELLLESLGFSIISRNVDQVESILAEVNKKALDVTSLYPFHMATNYLDGYKACCDIFATLLYNFRPSAFRQMFVNEAGHTVLDNLMISILKSHSSAMPVVVDDNLKDTTRFSGEEVDICGRWDADSPCVRHLLGKGNPATPFAWKHKFCHTSIQAICHCVIQMQQQISGDLIKTASGMYVRRCFDCGLKLQLLPLHSLVMTAYHLANTACQDEDLFGMLACLLCFISCGLNPRDTASVSGNVFLQIDATEMVCDHEIFTPAGLAEKVSTYPAINAWSAKVRLGWTVFCGILRLCEDHHFAEPESDVEDASLDLDYNHHFIGTTPLDSELRELHWDQHHDLVLCFRQRKDLATLWASVQAELLTYRRLNHDMGWISQNFSMEDLRNQLDRGELLSVRYAEQDLLKPHCICGSFGGYPLTTLSVATDPEIANLDIWERATYRYMR